MLPRPGVTGKEPFSSGSPAQKKAWLQRLYKIMQRTRTRTDADKVDAELAAAGLSNSLTGPFTPTDDEVRQGTAQDRLEALEIVLQTFPLALSPASTQNVAPSQEQVTVLTSLFGQVEDCYTQIAQGAADKHIKDIFSEDVLGQVRERFNSAAATVLNVKKVLKSGNPPAGSRKLRILLDISDELPMKSADALSAPLEMILPPSFATPTTVPVRDTYVDILLHECMHVLDSTIEDHTYWPDPNFTRYSFAVKFHNADHFAEVARRFRGTNTKLPGGGGGDPFEKIPKAEDKQWISAALKQARGQVKTAWIYSLDAWNVLRRLKDDPNYYDHLFFQRPSLRSNMMRISRISNATLHERDPAPGAWLTSVTEFDMALLEETIKDLAYLYGWTRSWGEIELVSKYPDKSKEGVLYVQTGDLAKKTSVEALANSFVEYAFSRFNQNAVWLQTNTLITNIRSMVANQKAFRMFPDKPYKPNKSKTAA